MKLNKGFKQLKNTSIRHCRFSNLVSLLWLSYTTESSGKLKTKYSAGDPPQPDISHTIKLSPSTH